MPNWNMVAGRSTGTRMDVNGQLTTKGSSDNATQHRIRPPSDYGCTLPEELNYGRLSLPPPPESADWVAHLP